MCAIRSNLGSALVERLPLKQALNDGVECASLETRRTVKQNVVPDHVLVEETNATTDNGLAILVGIPCKSDLRGKVQVRLLYAIAIAWECCVDIRIGRKVAVGTSGVAIITKTQAEGKIRLDFPGIAHVETDAVVRTQTASRKSEGLLQCAEALSVTNTKTAHVPIQRVGGPARKRPCCCKILT